MKPSKKVMNILSNLSILKDKKKKKNKIEWIQGNIMFEIKIEDKIFKYFIFKKIKLKLEI